MSGREQCREPKAKGQPKAWVLSLKITEIAKSVGRRLAQDWFAHLSVLLKL